MIEIWNVIVIFVCGLIAGATIHSAWLHSKERQEKLKADRERMLKEYLLDLQDEG